MRALLPSIEKEAAYLRRIPAFDPRFRQAYGLWGLSVIGVVAFALLSLGVWWLAPWNSCYLPEERRDIWFGVAVMPFAALLAATFTVEFVLKLVHVGVWASTGTLSVPTEGKVAGWIFGVLAAAAIALPSVRGDWDLWGYLALILSIPVLSAFLRISWDATYAKIALIRPTGPTSETPSRSHTQPT